MIENLTVPQLKKLIREYKLENKILVTKKTK